jgi:hypothetical protein
MLSYKQYQLLILLCPMLLSLAGCGGSNKPPPDIKEKKAPTVAAGEDQTVIEKSKVTIKSVGTDVDGNIVSYQWEQIFGPKIQLDNTDKAEINFTAPAINSPQTLTFKILVTDNDGLVATDQISISVTTKTEPSPKPKPKLQKPSVFAGPDQSVKEKLKVTISSTASDPDGNITSYQWRQISGASAQLDSTDQSELSFIAPVIGSPETKLLTFELVVTDNDGLTDADTVTVDVELIPSGVFNVSAIPGDGQVTLNWMSKEQVGLEYYRVIRSDQRNVGTDQKILNEINDTEVVIQDLTNGTPYYFFLTALNSNKMIPIAAIPKSPSTGLLNDTGSTRDANYAKGNGKNCFDKTGQQDCSHGRDYHFVEGSFIKAGFGHAGFDFSVLNADGSLYSGQGDYPSNPWACIRDNHTGLVWEVKTNDGGLHDKDKGYRWGGKTAKGKGFGEYYADWDVLVDGSNSELLCGYNDWRVPSLKELHGLVNYAANVPTINTQLFPNTNILSMFWSSSPTASLSNHAWFVFFGEPVGNYQPRNKESSVRLVRGSAY